MGKQGEFDWEKIYDEIPLEKMGWFHEALDPDLENELERLKYDSGTFLDLGTGAGTQAYELSKKGFTLTGTDISQNAIDKASLRYENIEFIQDDILNPRLNRQFDFIFDRGCFHCISEQDRILYIRSVSKLIKTNGILFLKCFSLNNLDIKGGPFRFSENMIRSIFNTDFKIEHFFETEYQGALKNNPSALFFVMKKK